MRIKDLARAAIKHDGVTGGTAYPMKGRRIGGRGEERERWTLRRRAKLGLMGWHEAQRCQTSNTSAACRNIICL